MSFLFGAIGHILVNCLGEIHTKRVNDIRENMGPKVDNDDNDRPTPISLQHFLHSRTESPERRGKMKHLLVFGVAFATIYICHSQFPEFCKSPFNEGNGSTLYVLIYYDATRDLCNPFRYSGEGGNANRFVNERECMRNCSAKAAELYPMDESQACHLPKKQGECLGQHLRFYYDPIHDKCKKFMWTGCVGNGNRFLDHKSCNATCDGIHDDGEGEEEDEPDTPVALICGVVFGVVGAIIIIVLVVLSAQSGSDSKKKPKKTKDPQTELPLQDKATEIA